MFRNVHLTPFLLGVEEDGAVTEGCDEAVEDMDPSETVERRGGTNRLAIPCFAMESKKGETVKDGCECEDNTDDSSQFVLFV